eukprot:TRINITY_DN4319_c0_g1_i1.p1 TRINITY_DN4319_c0_g1~~TRINITY_DN4319_c0_g1_i1.p1  ORF type:complete len:367 (+),score=12.98 TRINITY_DN4319_c0_g1_i1:229-1329(+)
MKRKRGDNAVVATAKGQVPVWRFPAELWEYIFQFLDTKDRFSIIQTCRHLSKIGFSAMTSVKIQGKFPEYKRIPNEVFQLPRLQSLECAYTRIPQSIMCQFSSLSSLILTKCTGDFYLSIDRLASLNHLAIRFSDSLKDNDLRKLPPNLHTLELQSCARITAKCGRFFPTVLTSMSLANCSRWTDCNSILPSTFLKTLNLARCMKLAEIPTKEQFPNLTDLNISATLVKFSAALLPKTLTRLDISDLTGIDYSTLKIFPNLRILSLRKHRLAPNIAEWLPKSVTHLDVCDTKVDDISELERLQFLRVSWNIFRWMYHQTDLPGSLHTLQIRIGRPYYTNLAGEVNTHFTQTVQSFVAIPITWDPTF